MAKSKELRGADFRAVHRLLGDCRELGCDSGLWHERLLDGVCRLVGGHAATGGEGIWARPAPLTPVQVLAVGLPPEAAKIFKRYVNKGMLQKDPFFQAIESVEARLITRTRRQVMEDAQWYGSEAYDFRSQGGSDDEMKSIIWLSDAGKIDVITVQRPRRERHFSDRECRMLDLLHDELGRLMGSALATIEQPGTWDLSPRQRQVLFATLRGLSEKEIARELDLAESTIHEYAQALRQHYNVTTGRELMARFIPAVRLGETKTPGATALPGDRAPVA